MHQAEIDKICLPGGRNWQKVEEVKLKARNVEQQN